MPSSFSGAPLSPVRNVQYRLAALRSWCSPLTSLPRKIVASMDRDDATLLLESRSAEALILAFPGRNVGSFTCASGSSRHLIAWKGPLELPTR